MKQSLRTKKSTTYYVRILHRDAGYLALGLTVVIALSGVLLIYKGTDFLKSPSHVEITLPQQLSSKELSEKLRLRHLEVTKDDGDAIYFKEGAQLQDGIYNKTTGATSFVKKQFPAFIERCISIHKINNSNQVHWLIVIYGLVLFFLAVSSLWMFKPRSRHFRRGLFISGTGMVLTVALLFMA